MIRTLSSLCKVSLSSTLCLVAAGFAISGSVSAASVSWTLGSDAFVGESWTLYVTGATPSTTIRVCASGSCTNVGTSDGSGNLTLTGGLSTGDVGAWYESWYEYPSLNSIGELDFYVHNSCLPSLSGIYDGVSVGASFDYWSGGVYQGSSYASGVDGSATIPSTCQFSYVWIMGNGRLGASEPGYNSTTVEVAYYDSGYSGFGYSQAGTYTTTTSFTAVDNATSRAFSLNISPYLYVYDY